MTTHTAKCRCLYCDGHIEFDTDSSGATVTCPHCGMDTTLYIPGAAPRAKPPAAPPAALANPKNKKLLRIAIILALIILPLAAVAAWIGLNAAQAAGMITSGIAALLLAIVAGLLFAIALLTAVLWLFFPVFMYFGMERLERRLAHIENNTFITADRVARE